MYKKQYVYIVEFKHGTKEMQIAFGDLDELRVYLVHGFGLNYDERKLSITDKDKETVYDHDGIKIKKTVYRSKIV